MGLWVLQLLLALAFGFGGATKLVMPVADLAAQAAWTGEVPPFLVRFIGFAELMGALGLLLPAALRIRPVLTPLAASGLALIMVLAMGFHIMRGEMTAIPVNFTFGALATFVAWGRFVKVPIPSRRSS